MQRPPYFQMPDGLTAEQRKQAAKLYDDLLPFITGLETELAAARATIGRHADLIGKLNAEISTNETCLQQLAAVNDELNEMKQAHAEKTRLVGKLACENAQLRQMLHDVSTLQILQSDAPAPLSLTDSILLLKNFNTPHA